MKYVSMIQVTEEILDAVRWYQKKAEEYKALEMPDNVIRAEAAAEALMDALKYIQHHAIEKEGVA